MNLIRTTYRATLSTLVLGVMLSLPISATAATDAGSQLSRYTGQAGVPASPARGERFFSAKHGREWSCASCHGAPPVSTGKHAATGKPISALAPAVDAQRFADAAKTEKWFRRNCNDVLGRECSAAEKADVLAWLLQLKP